MLHMEKHVQYRFRGASPNPKAFATSFVQPSSRRTPALSSSGVREGYWVPRSSPVIILRGDFYHYAPLNYAQPAAYNLYPPVSVWWDFENCPLPSKHTNEKAIVHNILQVVQTCGRLDTFRAYMDYKQLASHKCATARSSLEECGVSIIDCPHHGKKGVVDEKILADVAQWVRDHPPPATIILITGDQGFMRACNGLSEQGYGIKYIAPTQAHQWLKGAQTTGIYAWPGISKLRPNASAPSARIAAPNGLRSWSRSLPEDGNFFTSGPPPTTSVPVSKKSTTAFRQHPDASNSVSRPLVPIVDVLTSLRDQGIISVDFSKLGTLLLQQCPQVYRDAGVSKLKQYIRLAMEAGIVVLE